jgi:hypothetical protein
MLSTGSFFVTRSDMQAMEKRSDLKMAVMRNQTVADMAILRNQTVADMQEMEKRSNAKDAAIMFVAIAAVIAPFFAKN